MNPRLTDWLAAALERLLLRTNYDAYVILEDGETGKFVQFGRGPSLKLDVPMSALTQTEALRADEAFRRVGVLAPTNLVAPDVSNESELREHSILEMNFGTDARTAATVAFEVFDHVFKPTRPKYRLDEN